MSIWNLFQKSQPAQSGEKLKTVLLASEGRRFTDEVVDEAAVLAREINGQVRVLTIARLWGSGLGLPHPGLRPNKKEMAVHQDNVAWAIERLTKAGIETDGHIITSRNPGKSIDLEASRLKCAAIVMGADPSRGWFVGNFMWSQEPYRISRRARIPVHLICK